MMLLDASERCNSLRNFDVLLVSKVKTCRSGP